MTYENYTAFDLYDVILINNHKIDCSFSKASLIKIIEDNKIALPKKATKPAIDWYHSRYQYKSIICIWSENDEFYIQEDDIIAVPNGDRHLIHAIYLDDDKALRVVIKNIDTEKYCQVTAQEVIEILMADNTIYEYSSYIDYRFHTS